MESWTRVRRFALALFFVLVVARRLLADPERVREQVAARLRLGGHVGRPPRRPRLDGLVHQQDRVTPLADRRQSSRRAQNRPMKLARRGVAAPSAILLALASSGCATTSDGQPEGLRGGGAAGTPPAAASDEPRAPRGGRPLHRGRPRLHAGEGQDAAAEAGSIWKLVGIVGVGVAVAGLTSGSLNGSSAAVFSEAWEPRPAPRPRRVLRPDREDARLPGVLAERARDSSAAGRTGSSRRRTTRSLPRSGTSGSTRPRRSRPIRSASRFARG